MAGPQNSVSPDAALTAPPTAKIMPHSQTEINRLWRYPEVARYLGCSLSKAKRLRIPRVQIGRLVRFDPTEVRAWTGRHSIPRRPERG